jgi:hypothetical protein
MTPVLFPIFFLDSTVTSGYTVSRTFKRRICVNRDLEEAKKLLKEHSLAFAVVKDGQIVGTSVNKGVVDLLALVYNQGPALAGASLADKLVGKAVAAMVCQAGIRAVYTPLLSRPASDMLRRCDVPLAYDELVPMILSRDGKVRGPLEQLLLEVHDPAQAVDALRDFLKTHPMD